jgi:hypothetical protein
VIDRDKRGGTEKRAFGHVKVMCFELDPAGRKGVYWVTMVSLVLWA